MENYEVLKGLGKGACGKVSVVRSLEDGQRYVLKELPLEGKTKKEVASAHKELELLTTLAHPNIVKVVDSFESESSLYIVMEYAEQGDLERAVSQAAKTNSPFSEDQIIRWTLQIMLALNHMHSKHVLHRDLKTANVFLTRGGVVKLGDFGFSKQLTFTMDSACTMCGTPYYLPPEKMRGQPYNSKVDVWALGVILYELLALKKPWAATTFPELRQKVLADHPDPIQNGLYSKDLIMLCMSMLSKSPAARPSIRSLLGVTFVKLELAKLSESCKTSRASAISAMERVVTDYKTGDGKEQGKVRDATRGPTSVVPTSGQGGAQHLRMDPKMMQKFMAGPAPSGGAAPGAGKRRVRSVGGLDQEAPLDVRGDAATQEATAEMYRKLAQDAASVISGPLEEIEEVDTRGLACDVDSIVADVGSDTLQRAIAIFKSDISLTDAHGQVTALLGRDKAHWAVDIEQIALAEKPVE